MDKLLQLLNHYRRQPDPDLELIRSVESLLEDIESEGFNLREHRHALREDWLDRNVSDRKCPICGLVKVKSKAWVAITHAQKQIINRHPELKHVGSAVCKSCFMLFNNRIGSFSVHEVQRLNKAAALKKRIEGMCDELD